MNKYIRKVYNGNNNTIYYIVEYDTYNFIIKFNLKPNFYFRIDYFEYVRYINNNEYGICIEKKERNEKYSK